MSFTWLVCFLLLAWAEGSTVGREPQRGTSLDGAEFNNALDAFLPVLPKITSIFTKQLHGTLSDKLKRVDNLEKMFTALMPFLQIATEIDAERKGVSLSPEHSNVMKKMEFYVQELGLLIKNEILAQEEANNPDLFLPDYTDFLESEGAGTQDTQTTTPKAQTVGIRMQETTALKDSRGTQDIKAETSINSGQQTAAASPLLATAVFPPSPAGVQSIPFADRESGSSLKYGKRVGSSSLTESVPAGAYTTFPPSPLPSARQSGSPPPHPTAKFPLFSTDKVNTEISLGSTRKTGQQATEKKISLTFPPAFITASAPTIAAEPVPDHANNFRAAQHYMTSLAASAEGSDTPASTTRIQVGHNLRRQVDESVAQHFLHSPVITAINLKKMMKDSSSDESLPSFYTLPGNSYVFQSHGTG